MDIDVSLTAVKEGISELPTSHNPAVLEEEDESNAGNNTELNEIMDIDDSLTTVKGDVSELPTSHNLTTLEKQDEINPELNKIMDIDVSLTAVKEGISELPTSHNPAVLEEQDEINGRNNTELNEHSDIQKSGEMEIRNGQEDEVLIVWESPSLARNKPSTSSKPIKNSTFYRYQLLSSLMDEMQKKKEEAFDKHKDIEQVDEEICDADADMGICDNDADEGICNSDADEYDEVLDYIEPINSTSAIVNESILIRKNVNNSDLEESCEVVQQQLSEPVIRSTSVGTLLGSINSDNLINRKHEPESIVDSQPVSLSLPSYQPGGGFIKHEESNDSNSSDVTIEAIIPHSTYRLKYSDLDKKTKSGIASNTVKGSGHENLDKEKGRSKSCDGNVLKRKIEPEFSPCIKKCKPLPEETLSQNQTDENILNPEKIDESQLSGDETSCGESEGYEGDDEAEFEQITDEGNTRRRGSFIHLAGPGGVNRNVRRSSVLRKKRSCSRR